MFQMPAEPQFNSIPADLPTDTSTWLELNLGPFRRLLQKTAPFGVVWLAANTEKGSAIVGSFDGAPAASYQEFETQARQQRRSLFMGCTQVEADLLLMVTPMLRHKGKKVSVRGYMWSIELPNRLLIANTPAVPTFKLKHIEWRERTESSAE